MTRRILVWTGLAAALLMAAAACGPDTRKTWDRRQEVRGPVETGSKSIYLNRTLEELQILEPTRSGGDVDLKIQSVPTGSDPTQMKRSADGKRLFVLESGAESLAIYDLTASPPTRSVVGLDSPYDRMTVDPEGQFLLLSFRGDDSSDCIACNLNEVGVVDLRNGIPEEAQFETLPKRAEELIFAPNFTLAGGDQRLVAALSPSQISLLDLKALSSGDSTNAVREVPLTVSQAEAVKNPTKAVFHIEPSTSDGDGETDSSKGVSLYVLTQNGNDVTQVSIKPGRQMDSERKFDLSVNQLAAGRNPAAMTVLDLPEVGTRLLTLDGGQRRFHLVDVASGEGSSFELPMTAEDLHVYRTAVSSSEGNTVEETRILAWSTRSRLVAVIRPSSIAVGSDNPTVGRSVEAIRLEAPPSDVRMEISGQSDRAVALHSGAQAGFSVLDLEGGANDATFIKGSSLSDLQFSGSVAFGVFAGRPNFGRFNLQNGHPTTFELPSPGTNLLYDDEDKAILVDHDKRHGEFTVIDANEPSPNNATVYQGVFIRDLLQKELPEAE